jgi:hypothetical protein
MLHAMQNLLLGIESEGMFSKSLYFSLFIIVHVFFALVINLFLYVIKQQAVNSNKTVPPQILNKDKSNNTIKIISN